MYRGGQDKNDEILPVAVTHKSSKQHPDPYTDGKHKQVGTPDILLVGTERGLYTDRYAIADTFSINTISSTKSSIKVQVRRQEEQKNHQSKPT